MVPGTHSAIQAMNSENRYTPDEWAARLEEIELEIVRQAMICKVSLLQPGVIEKVLENDASVCGSDHPVAFETLRGLLVMQYSEDAHLRRSLGPDCAALISARARDHLQKRLGGLLPEALGLPPRDD